MQRSRIMKTSKAVWQQDPKSALFTIAMILCIIGIPALIAIFGFGQPLGKSFYIALVSGAMVFSLFFISTWFMNRWEAGSVVIDLLPVPSRRFAFLLGGSFILLGFLGTYGSASLSASASQLLSTVLGLSIGIIQILFGFSRLEIRENGIIVSVDFMVEFVPWNRIEAFEWVEADGTFSTLKFQYRTRFPASVHRVHLPVPMEKKQQLELLLEQHIRRQALGEKRL